MYDINEKTNKEKFIYMDKLMEEKLEGEKHLNELI